MWHPLVYSDKKPINTFFDYYNNCNKTYNILKKKKNTWIIKEGFFKFNMNINELKCSCLHNKDYCNHLIDFLMENNIDLICCFFILTNNQTKELYHNNHNSKDNNHNSKDINKIIIESIDECIICLDNIDLFNIENIFICEQCNKIIHNKCLQKWMKTNMDGNNKCPHCKNIIN